MNCCVCLNMTGTLVPMVTIVGGYALCADHADTKNHVLDSGNNFSLGGTLDWLRTGHGAVQWPRPSNA